ncbi:amidohydrolase [Sciscionella marina]|uniref:amidohydrolase n=1 Tax=Sciscionella marina TaxID=508770 RepID=UPI0012F662E8|nr:amidohydrolase [Sciscionella marina]
MPNVTLVNCTLPTADFAEGQFVHVREGRIAARGAMRDLRAKVEQPGEEIDVAAAAILPAFGDSHVHVAESGIELLRCDMTRARTREELFTIVADYSRGIGADEWVIGRGWQYSLFADAWHALDELERCVDGRPAYLNNANGHCAWVSERARAIAGIGPGTVDPPGGRLGRNADGSPNGMLYEDAMDLAARVLPPLTGDQLRAGLLRGQQEMLALGITSWQEAIVGDFVPTTDVFAPYRETEAAGLLRGRVTGCLWWPRSGGNVEKLARLREQSADGERFRCTAIKIMYDGSVGSGTALIEPGYLDTTAGNGISFFDREELAEAVRALDAAGFDLHFHSCGNRSTTELLGMIERAIIANGPRDRRHQLAHLYFLTDEHIDAMARLGILGNVQPYWAQEVDRIGGSVLPSVPEQLRPLIFRFRSLAERGVRLAFGSDWPVSDPNPLPALQGAVVRRPGHGQADPLNPAERLPLPTALDAATRGSAYAMRREDEIGSLDIGKCADLVVLDRPLRPSQTDGFDEVRVDYTFVDGEAVHIRAGR